MAGKGKFPKMGGVPRGVTTKRTPRLSAPVTHSSVEDSHPVGPVRRIPAGRRAPRGLAR